jgi:hypothetical protein
MGIFKELRRSAGKNKVMLKAIRTEENTYDSDLLESARRELYDFLLKDEVLSEGIRQFSFEQFCDAISYLKAMGLRFSNDGNYIPISTFCFLQPLAWVSSLRIDKELTYNEYVTLISRYFGRLVY